MILICPLNNELGLTTKVGARQAGKNLSQGKDQNMISLYVREVCGSAREEPQFNLALGVGSFEML
jgi:hypothetical protein